MPNDCPYLCNIMIESYANITITYFFYCINIHQFPRAIEKLGPGLFFQQHPRDLANDNAETVFFFQLLLFFVALSLKCIITIKDSFHCINVCLLRPHYQIPPSGPRDMENDNSQTFFCCIKVDFIQ